jgi:membrane protein required for colicin V production
MTTRSQRSSLLIGLLAVGLVLLTMAVVAWVGAGAITLYGFSWVYARVDPMVHNALLSQLIAGFGLFVISLVVLTILTGIVARAVRATGLSPIDRMPCSVQLASMT